MAAISRRQPVGAECVVGRGTHFRVWAPDHDTASVIIQDVAGQRLQEFPLERDEGGYFSALVPGVDATALYRYGFDGSTAYVPDPASRYQPFGPHGPSQVVDPSAYSWSDGSWPGITLPHQVLYEMHVGSFTSKGTWRGAIEHLPALAEFGITTIEMMPVADFAGEHGWGYDGVNLFAPTRLYGAPDDLRHFVDRAHAAGLGVILDVVYNHLGPSGNYLGRCTPRYFSTRYKNEWGEAINFDDDAGPVREFMASNAAYWIDEFHMDGLRIDATQQLFDASTPHVLAEIGGRARAAAAGRAVLIVAENEPQDTRLVQPIASGGFGFDALWNDDFHHTAVVALTGRREAYYTDYGGSPQEFISLAKRGFLYQGQRYSWQKARRGTPTRGLSPRQFITFLENHDQVANGPGGGGERLHMLSNPAMYRAVTAVWLLSPGTPMFFQGQEYGARTPFLYFADHHDELGAAVRTGRAEFMSQFRSLATRAIVEALPDPNAAATFARCVLDREAGQRHAGLEALHRDLLRLRRTDPIMREMGELPFDGAVLSPQAFVLRWWASDEEGVASHPAAGDRLLLVNFGVDLHLHQAPEPLLAPPAGSSWALLWSSEDPRYGGQGTAPLDTDDNWRLPGLSTVLLRSQTP